MHQLKCVLIFLLLFIPVTLYASVKEYTLDNGLKVLIIENHKAPVATFQIWYRVGSKDEPAGKSGLSHLLEHMMFKGTHQYGSQMFSKIVQNNGGDDNAYTTDDYTLYFQSFSSDKVMLSIDFEADRMQNLTLDQKEMLLERSVVMEERRLENDDAPQNSLFEEVVAASFKVHPYRRPVIGWLSDINSIEEDDLRKHYKANYSPDNAVIIVAGDVRAEEMMEKIKNSFGAIPSGPPKKIIRFLEPAQRGEKRVILKKEAELPYLLIAYHVPTYPSEDSYALDILSQILSDGKSSRLYTSLIYEKKTAVDVSADYDGFHKDPYLFFFSATASPGKDVKEVENALYAEIEKIKKEPPSEREVQKAKNQIESSFIMEQDSLDMEAMKYGTFEMLGDWRLIDKYLDNIRKVTPGDVVKVANKFLNEDNRTVGILVPKKSEE